MSMNTPLLKKLSECPGAPGFESRIRQLITDELKGLCDELYTDNIGNLYALKKGRERRTVMAAGHMDEIGFIVTHIDEDGFVFFHTLGGFDAKTLTAQRVIIHGKQDVVGVMSSKPIHVMSQEERGKAPKTQEYFIDTGYPREELLQLVQQGDPITRERELIEMGPCVNGKSLDNRLAVFILIECLRALKDKELPYDFQAVFTVQEEVGIRGASVAAHRLNPDFGIAIDTTIAYDLPGAKPQEKITSLGEGAAIKVMDSSAICDYRMVKFMKECAAKANLNYQVEILTGGGTDTAGVQRMGKNGAIAGAISIPTRHLHQVVEMAHKQDIQDAIQLMTTCLMEIDTFDWNHQNS